MGKKIDCDCQREHPFVVEAMDAGASFKTLADKEKYIRAIRRDNCHVLFWYVVIILVVILGFCFYYQRGYDDGSVASCRAVIAGVFP